MLSLKSPSELEKELGSRVKAMRLQQGWTQEMLAERSGVNIHSLKRFERSGKISLERLLCLAFVLGVINEFEQLFQLKMPPTIKELRKQQKGRKRGERKDKHNE